MAVLCTVPCSSWPSLALVRPFNFPSFLNKITLFFCIIIIISSHPYTVEGGSWPGLAVGHPAQLSSRLKPVVSFRELSPPWSKVEHSLVKVFYLQLQVKISSMWSNWIPGGEKGSRLTLLHFVNFFILSNIFYNKHGTVILLSLLMPLLLYLKVLSTVLVGGDG